MNHDERQQPDREPPKYVADQLAEAGARRSEAARMGTERKREAHAQLHEAWELNSGRSPAD